MEELNSLNQGGGNSASGLHEEEVFKKQMRDYCQDLKRAQKAQEDELKELNDRLTRTQEEKAKLVGEVVSTTIESFE